MVKGRVGRLAGSPCRQATMLLAPVSLTASSVSTLCLIRTPELLFVARHSPCISPHTSFLDPALASSSAALTSSPALSEHPSTPLECAAAVQEFKRSVATAEKVSSPLLLLTPPGALCLSSCGSLTPCAAHRNSSLRYQPKRAASSRRSTLRACLPRGTVGGSVHCNRLTPCHCFVDCVLSW